MSSSFVQTERKIRSLDQILLNQTGIEHIAVGIPPAAVFLDCHRIIILDGIAAGLLLREFLSQLGAVHTVELGRVIEETAAVIIRLNDAVQITVQRFALAQQVCKIGAALPDRALLLE